MEARPFYTYKICYLCIKQPIFLEPTFIKRLGKYSPDSPTFANLVCSDSPDSPTFANLFCSDSPDLPTFAKGHFWKKCDLPQHIRTSNERVSRIWGEWPLLSQNTINALKTYFHDCRFLMLDSLQTFILSWQPKPSHGFELISISLPTCSDKCLKSWHVDTCL